MLQMNGNENEDTNNSYLWLNNYYHVAIPEKLNRGAINARNACNNIDACFQLRSLNFKGSVKIFKGHLTAVSFSPTIKRHLKP